MEQKRFMEDCLHVHEDLLKVERQLHEWISSMTGIEPIDAAGRSAS